MAQHQQSPSQELQAVNGPTGEIQELQLELAVVLAEVLQRRNAVKNFLGTEAEEEIDRICKSFTAANRKIVSQRLLNAYCHNRYPRQTTILPDDAPRGEGSVEGDKK